MTDLRPCAGCRRHVRVSERACPFCQHTAPSPLLGRAALVGMALGALAPAACKPEVTPEPSADPANSQGAMVRPLLTPTTAAAPAYGIPPRIDAGATPSASAAPSASASAKAAPGASAAPERLPAPPYGLPRRPAR